MSNVTGVPKTTPEATQEAFAFKVILAGATIVGNVTSETVTVWVAVAVFPLPSFTVHVTVVVPRGKTVGALLVIWATEQLSAVTGVPKTTLNAAHALFALTVTLAGAVIVGVVTSVTVTNWVAVDVFPLPSITVQITVVVPSVNDAGALFVTETTEQLSAVTGVPSTTPVATQAAFAVTVLLAGAMIDGLIKSTTVTFWVAVALFPLLSITVQVTTVVPNG